MRIHKLLATVLAAGLVFSGCHQDEDYLLPDIEINAESLDFSDDTELKISLTASRDWLVRSKPDWVAVDPDHGSASSNPQRVVISVLPNNDYNRTGEVLFTIGLDKAAVEVIQPGAKGEKPRGSGTLEDPYTVGGVLDYVKSLGADVESPQDVYIKGKISSVTEAYSSQFGNGTFVIKGESADETFTVYRALYLGNKKWTDKDTQIKEGDDVIVCGKVIYFKGNTPETQQNKAYLYSLNGEVREAGSAGTPAGEGTLDKPYNVAGVLNYINTLGADVESPSEVYISGEIAEVTEAYSSNFGNGTFTIKDADADAVFTVYRALYLGNQKYADGNTQIKVGDKVVVCGKVINYKGNTPETQQNKAYLYSLNGTTAGGSSSGGEQGGSQGGGQGGGQTTADVKTVTVAQFNAAEVSSTQKYQLTGTIGGTINETYGNFDLTDETGKVYVYGLTESEKALTVNADGTFKANNDKSYSNLGLKAGDVVTIIGYRSVFNNQIQVLGAYYVKREAGSSQGGEQGGSQGGEQGGSGTTPGNDGSGSEGGSQGGTQTEDKTLFSQAFKTDGQGKFTIEDKTLPEGLSYVWKYDDRYGMKASAYVSQKNYAAESWLISPLIDLTSATKPVLTFRHAMNYFSSVEKSKEEATLWVRIEGGEWTQLTITAYPAMDFKFVDSGEISLLNYTGKKKQIAFKYKSTEDKAGTWEVDDFKVINKTN